MYSAGGRVNVESPEPVAVVKHEADSERTCRGQDVKGRHRGAGVSFPVEECHEFSQTVSIGLLWEWRADYQVGSPPIPEGEVINEVVPHVPHHFTTELREHRVPNRQGGDNEQALL